MKANLPQSEPKTLARWSSERIYEKIREARAGRPMYVLHDGPPYANGAAHLGHAFNKVLKDFIVKSRTMQGFDSPYVPGWDCHGLPIEIKVDGELGAKKAKMTTAQIRGACRRYAQKYVDSQRKSFIRLGVFGRWNDPYLTMSAQYESVIARAFVDFLHKDYVYKGLKPVNWCIHDRTALAEAEVEYENHTSPSIWVRFALKSDPAAIDPALAGKKVFGLIWTTTPWTIPANMAIAYHPKFEYVAAETGDGVFIVALELLKATAERCGWGEPKILAAFPGERLEGTIFAHPFLDRDSLGILAEHVTLEQGTGAVHTAPGHGQEDFDIARKYQIATYCPVDGAGRFFHAEGAAGRLPDELIGKTVWEANPIVIEILRSHGALAARQNIEHSYPHCWRCHNATIFRATEQWFIGMERNDLRQRALKAIQEVKWYPDWGGERISNMVATRPDWCISRQRIWGVPILAFYCENCQEPLIDRKVLDRVVKLFAEKTSDVWFERSAAELAGPEARCAKCGGSAFRKENDILDVWFDSGASQLAVLTPENGLPWPSNMYLEGGDQYRGWFHSSLLIGVGLKGGAPYRECAKSGWTLDADGKAMSKSAGNGIDPEDVIKRFGADVLRLWVASVDFTDDARLSEEILARLTESYRKLRNTFRWALGNLADFDPQLDGISPDRMIEFDQWLLVRAEDLVAKCRDWYNELEFHKIYHAVHDFAVTDLSALYFDVAKDRLYTFAPASHARRSAQTALYRVTNALVRLLAPILAYTTEEVWSHFAKPANAPASIHLATFLEAEEITGNLRPQQRERLANWDRLLAIREEVLKSLEAPRQRGVIGKSLDARIRIQADSDLYPLLREYETELPALFIVSQVAVENGNGSPISVDVERAEGEKCERCWKYAPGVGEDELFPTVCAGCGEALREILGR